MKEIKSEESWNKKRIFTAFFLTVLLVIGGYLFKVDIFGKNSTLSNSLKSVKGASSEERINNGENLNVDLQKAVKEQLNNLKQEVSGLNILEVASSSPQIQKIINDIKDLEKYPTDQIKDLCKKICGL